MNAGMLNKRIVIEQLVNTRTSSGGVTTDWATFASNIAASIKPLSGRELYRFRQEQVDVTTNIVIRFRRGVTEAMRIKYIDYGSGRSKYYDIEVIIDPEEAHRELQMICRENV